MKRSNVIYDGYNQEGYILAEPRMHEELRFTYRPVLIAERDKFLAEARDPAAPPGTFSKLSAALVATKIKKWSLVDDQDRPQSISKETMLTITPTLFTKICDVVLGFTASDEDPTWTKAQAQAYDEAAAEARMLGVGHAEARENIEAKNSEPASG